MDYKFLPNLDVALDLQKSFKFQLKSSYMEMLEQLHAHDARIFPYSLVTAIASITPSELNGFHNFVYHYGINLMEESNFLETARLIQVLVNEKYSNLPKFVPGKSIDQALMTAIFKGTSTGTTHKAIRLYPVDRDVEETAISQIKVGTDKLNAVYPEIISEINILVDSVLFFDSGGETSERALSLTGNRFQSLILVNGTIDPNWVFLLDKIVHEAAHCYLFAINLREEMITNTEGARYVSPLRRDARDMMALYHATFVIQRLILAFTYLLENGVLNDAERQKIIKTVRFYHSRLDAGFDTVMQHGKLSAIARDLIREGQDFAHSLRSSAALEGIQA